MSTNPRRRHSFPGHRVAALAVLLAIGLSSPVLSAYGPARGDRTAATSAAVASEATTDATPSVNRRYTFSWRFVDGDAMAPRGGTTRGPEPTLAPSPSERFKRLAEMPPGKARDRAAILAMAGDYRVSFDFLEVAGFTGERQPQRPYQSWATERVIVVEDSPDRIVLQHVLLMRFLGEDGTVSEPMLTKHWRQDWRWEPEHVFEYLGDATWQRRAVPESERRGAWAQDVFQVDDSPRYSGVGRWEHRANYSTWTAGDGARPLPRREWSVRKDYGLLHGSNRHTITPDGWVHEQLNQKIVSLADPRVVAREFGFNRYEAIADDLAEAGRYWEATAPMWAIVRARWDALLATGQPVALKAEPDQGALFIPLFEKAQAIADGKAEMSRAGIEALVDAYLRDAGEPQS